MGNDPYTIRLRLCDDAGFVSHKEIIDSDHPMSVDKSYLDRLNRLRVATPSIDDVKPITERFLCTGTAHLANEHFLCTSPAHQTKRAETELLSINRATAVSVPSDAPGGWPEFTMTLTFIVKSDDEVKQEEAVRHKLQELIELVFDKC